MSQNTALSLENIIATAIQIPGVKVNRETFLLETFKNTDNQLKQRIITSGPVKAGCSRVELKHKAERIVRDRTMMSTAASFAAGLPGGLAIAATIPMDMLQFYSVALRMAQEISYLYGGGDFWVGNAIDMEKVTNQLILYCGVMLGATGAVQAVRVMAAALAKQALKKIPQKALTKTFYYPIVKSIAKAFGAKMTKNVFARGVSKAIPVIGGFVSGGITFASMLPMGNRLVDALDQANFVYTDADLEKDIEQIIEVGKTVEDEYSESELGIDTALATDS